MNPTINDFEAFQIMLVPMCCIAAKLQGRPQNAASSSTNCAVSSSTSSSDLHVFNKFNASNAFGNLKQ